jgi:lipoic acid synthetase
VTPSPAAGRLPEWARKGSPLAPGARPVRMLLRGSSLHTVCEEARCPNVGECFSRGTATFLLLGDRCTRRCGYCSVTTGRPLPPDPDEPRRVAQAAARMGLRHVVLTSVDRDDLPDGGAAHFAAAVREVRRAAGRVAVEVLVPDFSGDRAALGTLLEAGPEVFNHNVETAPRLFPRLRRQGSYSTSLEVLAAAKALSPGQTTKSGLMVGLGETDDEVTAVLADLAAAGVDIVTIGQYLRPSLRHEPVHRYVAPEVFVAYEERAHALGIPTVYAGVFVRSSFNAEEIYRVKEGR